MAGKVRGIQNGKISAFKGIHYGAPTTGKGRFMPPSKVEPWSDVKDCFDIGQRAPQLPGFLVPEYSVMERTEPNMRSFPDSTKGAAEVPVSSARNSTIGAVAKMR